MDEKDAIKSVLENCKTVAVVGLSKDPSKDSFKVAQFLQSKGYRIIPINPFADQVLGETCYKSLLEMPEALQKAVEIVDVFRPSAEVPSIVDQAVELKKKFGKPNVVWMQLGIVNEEAAKKAEEAGLTVVMDRCMMVERRKLGEEVDVELGRIRAKKMQELGTMMRKSEVVANSPITLDDTHFYESIRKHPVMLIDCWAEWCGPCRMIAPVIDELARDYGNRLAVGKLNVDENPETAMKFGIVSIPTLLIIKNGEEVDRIVGALPKTIIEERLKRHL